MIAAMDLLPFLIGALATARITRLITADKILERPRNAILLRLDEDGLMAYLVQCAWCVSVYTGAGVAAGGAWAGVWSWWWAGALALSFSYVAGILASWEGE